MLIKNENPNICDTGGEGLMYVALIFSVHGVHSELKGDICNSNEWPVQPFSFEMTIYIYI